MSALAIPTLEAPARKKEPGRQVVLPGISWQAYKTIREALSERYIFLTYDKGTLEIMTLSAAHERYKGKFHLLFHLLARHFRINYENWGSFTQQRQDLDKGVEADDCYYIQSLPAVMGKIIIDLERDPPPDLAMEVDVTHSSMDRIRIYQTLKIPQVWRFDGRTLQVLVLVKGKYELREFSPTFPGIPMAELVRFVKIGIEMGEMVMTQRFEKWLRKFPVAGRKRKKR